MAGTGGSGGSGTGGSGGGGVGQCTAPAWDSTKVYMTGDRVSRNGMEYVAKYYNQNMDPATNHEEPNMSPAGKPWDVPKPC